MIDQGELGFDQVHLRRFQYSRSGKMLEELSQQETVQGL